MADIFDRLTAAADGVEREEGSAKLSGGRVGSRDSLLLMAHLRLAGEQQTREVRVRNLSERGLMLELDKMVAIATPVQLDVRGIGEVGGKVAWCTEGRVGVAFDSPVDPKKARKAVGASKPVDTSFQTKATSGP
ncbi:PilZ domain-containing protein [Sphingomonas sp. M1A8_2b]